MTDRVRATDQTRYFHLVNSRQTRTASSKPGRLDPRPTTSAAVRMQSVLLARIERHVQQLMSYDNYSTGIKKRSTHLPELADTVPKAKKQSIEFYRSRLGSVRYIILKLCFSSDQVTLTDCYQFVDHERMNSLVGWCGPTGPGLNPGLSVEIIPLYVTKTVRND